MQHRLTRSGAWLRGVSLRNQVRRGRMARLGRVLNCEVWESGSSGWTENCLGPVVGGWEVREPVPPGQIGAEN